MPIGANRYSRRILKDEQWQALEDANVILIDQMFDDIAALQAGKEIEELWTIDLLPPAFRYRYDVRFLEKMLVCLVSVGLKHRMPGFHPLGCTGEEIAVHMMITQAIALLETHWDANDKDGKPPIDFGGWIDVALDDADVDLFYHPAFDGIESSDAASHFGFAHLRFNEWFLPFDPPRVMHPYADDSEQYAADGGKVDRAENGGADLLSET